MYLTRAYTAKIIPIPSRVQPKASRDPKAATILPTVSSSGAQSEIFDDSKAITKAKRAIALFSYEPVEPNELRLLEGDTITGIDMLDLDWWAGENHGVRGLFPQNYVELIEDNDRAYAETPHVRIPDAVVLWNHNPKTKGGLRLTERDLITNITHIDVIWWLGKDPRGVYGHFPNRIVELISTNPNAPPLNIKTIRAMWDFKRREENELDFKKGDRFTVINVPSPDWWIGQNSEGAVGLIPSNHVQVDVFPGVSPAAEAFSEGSDGG